MEEERQSAVLRQVLWYASQLRALQRNRLQAEIVDPVRREGALERLDRAYERVLSAALGDHCGAA